MSYIPESILSKYEGFIVTKVVKSEGIFDEKHYTKITLISSKWWRPHKSFSFRDSCRSRNGVNTWSTQPNVIGLYNKLQEYYENK